MADNEYQPPTEYQPVQPQKQNMKKDPQFIKLQVVEHDISEFKCLAWYIFVILAITIAKLIIDIVYLVKGDNDPNTENPASHSYFDLALRVIQLTGYGYGLQAYNHKDSVSAQIFLFYLYASFMVIAYLAFIAFEITNTFYFIFDCSNIVLNIFVIFLFTKFLNLLKKRDDIKRYLEETRAQLGLLRV